ncbi:tetratricopeptide repeat protein [Alteromonas sp. HB246098]
MTIKKRLSSLVIAGLTSAALITPVAASPDELLKLQQQWATVNYQLEGDAQLSAFSELIEQAKKLVEQSENSAESLTWLAISQSSTASAKGGLGALDFAESAKENLERAIEKEESVLDGTALTVLAALYHKVPGWPVSFGSDKKAEKLFKRALEINPQGMDQNFFYAEYLFDDGEYEKAQAFLSRAQNAPEKANRPLADKKRREEIAALQARLDTKA